LTRQKSAKPDKTAQAEKNRATAVAMVLAGHTQEEIADELDVQRTTVSAWMQEPSVRAELERANEAIVDAAVAKLKRLSGKAVETLETWMGSEEGSVAVGAAKAVLDRIEKLGAKTTTSITGPIVIDARTVNREEMRLKARAVLEAKRDEYPEESDDPDAHG
jgi:DNA-binding XRE family transcriptional regulator